MHLVFFLQTSDSCRTKTKYTTHTRTRRAEKMPRGRTETPWSEIPVPATPLQRGAYLDACTAWLVQDATRVTVIPLEVPTTDPLTTRRHMEVGSDDASSRPLSGRFDRRNWRCVACHSEVATADAAPQIGNPFAQNCLVVACAACRPR